MTFAMKQIVGGALVLALTVSGGMVLAKAHDQGPEGRRGASALTTTVGGAHTLGASQSGGKGLGPQ